METHAQSQHALLTIYTINTQSVVLHQFIKVLCPSLRVYERKGGGLPSEGCLGSAVSCQLFLLPPVERKNSVEIELNGKQQRNVEKLILESLI